MSFIIIITLINPVITVRREMEIFTLWNVWNRIKIHTFIWSHLLTVCRNWSAKTLMTFQELW